MTDQITPLLAIMMKCWHTHIHNIIPNHPKLQTTKELSFQT